MRHKRGLVFATTARSWMIILLMISFMESAFGADLHEIQERGVLRHLGVPYARFVTGDGDGLDEAFNRFFNQCQQDGTYLRLVKKYYPAVLRYYAEFFEEL